MNTMAVISSVRTLNIVIDNLHGIISRSTIDDKMGYLRIILREHTIESTSQNSSSIECYGDVGNLLLRIVTVLK